MNWLRSSLLVALLACAALSVSAPVYAQDGGDEGDAAASEESAESKDGDADESTDEDGDDEEDEEESEHGSYEWKASYGGGFELGLWFSPLDRWNAHVLDAEPNDVAQRIDINSLWYADLFAEASVLEGTRFSIFGGLQRPFKNDPSIGAFYIGFEPAFAFRRDSWELALGIGAGLGSTRLELDTGETMSAGLVLLRPFFEVRRYLNTWSALYLRGGFQSWLVNNPEFEGLDFNVAENNLDEGGPHFALGVRFGHYPEHVKVVGDSDGDGMRDDVDECPEDPEDFDGFEDDDGCPELDNDGDGIPDADDKCPLVPEDMDGWQDDDGCPESDDDADGDGILNVDDKCPNEPEDFDKFQDEDGCPDPDNDGDGILDKADKCPLEPGVKAKEGCPFELVKVTEKAIVISQKVFFELDKATIKEESFELLNQVAGTINAFPRIKKIEIAGHTDHAGSEKYNNKLSQERADSVMKYLVEEGEVDPARLQAKGYGESKPLVPLGEDGKETKEDAAKNRRVEFNIVEQETITKTVREDKLKEAGQDKSKALDSGMKKTVEPKPQGEIEGETPDPETKPPSEANTPDE